MKIRLKTTFKSIEEARKALCQCDSCSECPSGASGKAITPNYSRMNEQFFVTKTEYEGLKWLYEIGARYISRDSYMPNLHTVSVWKDKPRWVFKRGGFKCDRTVGYYSAGIYSCCTTFDSEVFSFVKPGECIGIQSLIELAVISDGFAVIPDE